MMSLLTRNIRTVVLISILVVGGAWYVFSRDTKTDDTLLTSETVLAESTVEKGIVETLLTLRAVSLSGTIFSDPAFRVLKDFGTQIIQEPVGRPNPFAPRGAATSTRGDTISQVVAPEQP